MIRVANFTGEVPRMIPRLLPDTASQLAVNAQLNDGALTPVFQPLAAHDFGNADTDRKTIWRVGEDWYSSTGLLDVVRAPVADNRFYMTGGERPSIAVDGFYYDLKLIPPQQYPDFTVSGSIDTENFETIVYAYTWVTGFDEESAPSPVSGEFQWSSGVSATITTGVPAQTDRNINRVRFYRSQTGDSGATELYFVREVWATDFPVTFTDDVTSNPIQEAIPSLNYDPPPDTLSGLIALPNGMMAAFSGRDLYFCEPYLPHAWPEKYVLTTDFAIVALGAFGSSVAVLTTGTPYIVTGTAPENMTMERTELTLPCINKRGVVDLGPAVAYPSTDGLVQISDNGASLVTASLLTPVQWNAMRPGTWVAGRSDSRYVAAYDYTDEYEGPQRGMIVFDLSGAQPFIIRSDACAAVLFSDIENGALYFMPDGQHVMEWNPGYGTLAEMVWRSKKFVLPGYTNFGAILIEGGYAAAAASLPTISIGDGELDGEILAAQGVTAPESGIGVTVFADGRPVITVSEINRVMRMPAGFTATCWEFEVRGASQVTAVTIASSPTDIAEAGSGS